MCRKHIFSFLLGFKPNPGFANLIDYILRGLCKQFPALIL